MNGNETGRKHQSARELTAEIDRATDPVLARSQAGNLGSRVLTYNSELNPSELHNLDDHNLGAAEGQKDANVERVREMAERDDGDYAYANREDLTGVETQTQVAERMDEDQEDVANERGENGMYVKDIMDRNNKRITKETVAAVDSFISKHEYHPGQLDALTNKARTTFLKNVFNRILGSRN